MTHKTYVFAIILTACTSFAFAQTQVFLIDFGESANKTSGNWNNFTVQNQVDTQIILKDYNSGTLTEVKLKLTDIFDRYQIYGKTQATASGVFFGGAPLPETASRDNFFGERIPFDEPDDIAEPTGGFTFSGLDKNKYYSFRIFASRETKPGDVLDNKETKYTVLGKLSSQDAFLNATDNIDKVAKIISVQPNSSGEIILEATTGPKNTNAYGFYYLGAIEMTASNTPSTTTWDGAAWDNAAGPNASIEAIIDGPYNTRTHGSFNAYDLKINTGKNLTIANNTYIEIEQSVVVNGELLVETQGNFVQNDDSATFLVNTSGLARVRKETPFKPKWYYYTYWSSPVEKQIIKDAFPEVDSNRRFWFNAENYLDVNQDDIDDSGDDWQIAEDDEVMTPGRGYIATAARLHKAGSDSVDFIGPFNNGIIPAQIFYNSVNKGGSWNLIGNPYPSAIDFDTFYTLNSEVVEGAIYLWSQATEPSADYAGNQVLNFSQDDYIMYSAGSGGIQAHRENLIPNGYIASGQSFMIASKQNGFVHFNNTMRMADNTSNKQFFKSSNSKSKDVKNKLWINLTSDNGVFNQILTAYINGATNDDDGSYYDAPRIIGKDYAAVLYTQIENSNKKFAIQGKAANSLDANDNIKLGFASKIKVATLYQLSIAQIEGDFLKNNTIYLKDNLLNKTHNLSASNYTFTSDVGEFNERFVVLFSNQTLSNDLVLADDSNPLKIIDLENDSVKFVTSNHLKIKSVAIFDLLGRQLYQFKGQHSEEIYNLSHLKNAIYIAKIELSNGTIISKKAVKK